MSYAQLLKGKKGLIMGLSNDRSIAWGIAQVCHEAGAELAFTYTGEAMGKRAIPLAEGLGAKAVFDCDVTKDEDISRTFARLKEHFGPLDFIVHAIAFSNKDELRGMYLNTSRANFAMTMDVSCFSFTAVAKAAYDHGVLADGASLLTLSYYGAEKVIPNYNVMGVAKAALEASVRYLANDLGPQNVRVNAISAGPIKTLAASGIGEFSKVLAFNEANAPLRRNMTTEDVGRAALALLSPLSSGISGEVIYVDGGFNTLGMPGFNDAGESA
jgi:enoyl-[acyl-carrier protein] reductase I